jgi:transposase
MKNAQPIRQPQATNLAQDPGKDETEGGRRPTGVSPFPGGKDAQETDSPPETEVMETIPRRRFSAEYKIRILLEADACEYGQLGVLLRREGLYYSHIKDWRKQRERGTLDALSKKRGRKKSTRNPLASEVARLEREKLKLEEELRKARIIIEYQKKNGGSPDGAEARRERVNLAQKLGYEITNKSAACEAMSVSKATFYRYQQPETPGKPRPAPPLALTSGERRKFWMSYIPNDFRMMHPIRCMQPFLMRAATFALFGPCIAYLRHRTRSGSDETSRGTGTTSNRSCWQRVPIRFGRGILPNFWGRPNGPTSIST